MIGPFDHELGFGYCAFFVYLLFFLFLVVMDLDIANRDGNKRVYNRLGPPAADKSQKVCFHWQAGRCNRYECPYLHSELPSMSSNGNASKRSHQIPDNRGFRGPSASSFSFHRNSTPNSNPNAVSKWGRGRGSSGGGGRGGFRAPPITIDSVCIYWIDGRCIYGDNCKFRHSWFSGDCFTFLTLLEGHQKAVTGIALPSGSDKLYSGSKDESVRLWDCQTGQCTGVINLGGEIGCMISEGPWIFVGIPSFVKAWNTQTSTDLTLSGPVGQVYTLVVGNEMLFAGTQDGSILAWKFIAVGNCFEPAAALPGHSSAVVSLVVGANRLYSGSMDNTIKVWDLSSLQCIQTLTEHTSVVMSVLCWDQFLLSCSLDQTIKVWVATESGNLEVTYTHKEEPGVLALCGMHDAQAKPVLLCACNDNSVRLYDLPSFAERGKIFSREEVRAMQIGPGGLFFTGDGTGELKVWKWLSEPATA